MTHVLLYDTLQTDQYDLLYDPCHLGVPSGVPKMISEPVTHSAQSVHLSSIEIGTTLIETEMSLHLTHVT
jgi:hypothetical protein